MKKKYLGFVCFIYVFIIIYVWLSGNLNNYLAPNMQFYLKLSIIPISIIGVLFLVCDIHYKFKYSDLLLVIPLIVIILAGDGNLSVSFAQNKVIKISRRSNEEIVDNNKVIDTEVVDNNQIVDNSKKEEEQNNIVVEDEDIYFDIDDSVYSYLADYITYMSGAQKYVGKTIKFRGFAVDYSEYLPSGYVAIGKYYISCCAADAEFSGFVVKQDGYNISENSWYEVEGVLELAKDIDGYNIMTIVPKTIKKIKQGDESQYVYQCNNYGDGKCSNLLEYDLGY